MSAHSFLTGKKVLLTREERDNAGFADLIREAGGEPVSIPMIGFRPRDLDDKEKEILANLQQYDWLVLTSKNGVDFFFRQVEKEIRLPDIAVIGTKTKEALEQYGHVPQFVPSQFVAECFVEELIPGLANDVKVLVVKGNLARDLIADSVRAKGHICDEVILYENAMPESSEEKLCEAIKNEQLDILTFASSSAVRHFMQVVEKHELRSFISHCVIACIGPIAQKTAEQHGLHVQICAQPYTIEGLVASLIDYRE